MWLVLAAAAKVLDDAGALELADGLHSTTF